MGYQHFGGIPRRSNPLGTFASQSPIKIAHSKPYWSLAADTTIKIDNQWGGGRNTAYKDAPQHRRPGSAAPEGGNQMFIDEAARFIKFERMYYLHTRSTDGTRKCYFHQDASDFEDRMRGGGLATTLRAMP